MAVLLLPVWGLRLATVIINDLTERNPQCQSIHVSYLITTWLPISVRPGVVHHPHHLSRVIRVRRIINNNNKAGYPFIELMNVYKGFSHHPTTTTMDVRLLK
jgi:hypothetical protein